LSDAVLETLLLPFDEGVLSWPAQGTVLFLRARASDTLLQHAGHAGRLLCCQTERVQAARLEALGLPLQADAHVPLDERNAAADAVPDPVHHPLVLLLPPRARDEARALLARAVAQTAAGGWVVASAANNEGARSLENDLAQLVGGAGRVISQSKHKCRVFRAQIDPAAIDTVQLAQWRALDAPQRIANGRFLSRPGLFAWDRIDAASALLARCLPADLAGRGADLGAGYGYLCAELLQRCPHIEALDLYECEQRALEMAHANLQPQAGAVRLDYLWHDVASGLLAGRQYDFIVSNPPFHDSSRVGSRNDRPELGQAFIRAAARGLRPGGHCWLVANRHLPYEAVLTQYFTRWRSVCAEQGYKVIEAIR
jgi:16S rRNA (guanine1207-N2)-methyltransferase